jgi:hypothetical protein
MVPHHIASPPSATIPFLEMMLVLLKNLIVVNFFIVSFHPETSEIPSPLTGEG